MTTAPIVSASRFPTPTLGRKDNCLIPDLQISTKTGTCSSIIRVEGEGASHAW
jgi:hypothetical protein